MSAELLPEILKELREIRSETSENRVLLERNTVTLEELTKRHVDSESRIKVMEGHITTCPARAEHQASENLWRRVKNYAVVVTVVATILAQLIPWWKSR